MKPWTIEELRARRKELLAVASRHGVKNVRVFGSVARGEAGPLSDVDFVVEFEPGTSLLDHGALIMDFRDLLGCKVDVISARGMKERLRARVEAEAVGL